MIVIREDGKLLARVPSSFFYALLGALLFDLLRDLLAPLRAESYALRLAFQVGATLVCSAVLIAACCQLRLWLQRRARRRA